MTPPSRPGSDAEPVAFEPPTQTEHDLRRVAVRRLKRKQAFRSHLFVYVTINALFWTMWIVGGLVSQWIVPWPLFPTIVWGLFVVGWWRDLYGRRSITEDQIQREVERLRHASNGEPHDVFDLRDRSFFDPTGWPFDRNR